MSSAETPAVAPPGAPREGTVERWAWDFIATTSLETKLAPPPAPLTSLTWEVDAPARTLAAPGRPRELRRVAKAPKTRGLASPAGRARTMHTFFHHELQAAELMAWALLAFPETPRDFRAGLLRIAEDEVRHMGIYAGQVARLGYQIGDFPVRDWFWERVPACSDAASFVATMGLGFEAANLEHASLFAARFRTAGDEEGARAQEVVGRDEVAHVRFGARWFSELRGGLTFDAWSRALPAPLSPMLMRGHPLDRAGRAAAGFPEAFLDELEAWRPGS